MNKNTLLLVAIAIIVVAIMLISQTSQKISRTDIASTSSDARVAMKAAQYPHAVELVNPSGFLNSEPFNLSDFIGKKVILIDFWTYSCINCQRTLPYLTAWDEKYRDDGLLIVGIETPEFEFEKNADNVRSAMEQFGIKYPVVQDNDYGTWHAYQNRYWPHKYLIDIDGFIVYDHIGEGGYAQTEVKIRELLNERAELLGGENFSLSILPMNIVGPDFDKIGTRELYFGYEFDRGQLGNPQGLPKEKTITYSAPKQLEDNTPYFNGTWYIGPDAAEVMEDYARVILHYDAKNVHIVAGSDSPVILQIFVDGQEYGSRPFIVNEQKLYTVVSGTGYGKHDLEIIAPEGFRLYTFTFG